MRTLLYKVANFEAVSTLDIPHMGTADQDTHFSSMEQSWLFLFCRI